MDEIAVPVSIFLVIVLLLGVVAMIVSPAFSQAVEDMAHSVAMKFSHADEKHGEDAVVARQCFNNANSIKMYNPTTKRTSFVCLTDTGKYGIVILEETGEEVTAFLKNKMKSLEQVINYMKNAGYQLLN